MTDESDPQPDDRVIRRYVLGALSGSELEEVEARLFATDDFAETIDAIEAELADDYVTGDLDADERACVEKRLRVSPSLRARMAFARRLAGAASRATAHRLPATRTPRAAVWWTLAAAAAVVVIAGGVWLNRDAAAPTASVAQGSVPPGASASGGRGGLPPSPPPTPMTGDPAPTIIATVTLWAVAVRDPTGIPVFKIPAGQGLVRIDAGIDDADVYPLYEVALETAGGEAVTHARDLPASRASAGRMVTLRVPSDRLGVGRYAAHVFGRRGTTVHRLSVYTFDITR